MNLENISDAVGVCDSLHEKLNVLADIQDPNNNFKIIKASLDEVKTAVIELTLLMKELDKQESFENSQ